MKRYLSKSYWLDRDIEQMLGNLLRFGVLLSAIVTAIGGILYLIDSGSAQHPALTQFKGRSEVNVSLKAILAGAFHLDSTSVMLLGVLLLVATPVIRVLFSFFAFLLERDYLYVVLTLILLFIIGFNVLGGFA